MPMKKWLTGAAVILLLVVFPIISWLYLKKGYDYQKASFAELAEYKQIDKKALASVSFTLSKYFQDGKTKVVSFLEKPALRDTIIPKILTQFAKANQFQWIQIVDSVSIINWNLEKPSPSFVVFFINNGEYQRVKEFLSHADYDLSNEVIIIDTQDMIRNHYNLDRPDDQRKLVVHIAMLLPRDDKE